MAEGASGSLVATIYSPGGYPTKPRPVEGDSPPTIKHMGYQQQQHSHHQHSMGHGLPDSHSDWPAVRRSNSSHSVLGDDQPSSTRYVHTIQVTDSPPPGLKSPSSSIEDNWSLKEGRGRRLHSYDSYLTDNLTDWASSEDLQEQGQMAHRPAAPRGPGPQQFRYVIRSPYNQQVRGYPSPYRHPSGTVQRHHSPPARFPGQPVGQAIYVHGPRSPRSPGPLLVRGPPPAHGQGGYVHGGHVQGHNTIQGGHNTIQGGHNTIQGGQAVRSGQMVYRHPGGYATTPRQVVYMPPRATTPPASAQRLYIKNSTVHLNRSPSRVSHVSHASHASHASSSGLVARAQGGARNPFPTMPRLARSNSTGDLLDDPVDVNYQTLPKNFAIQREPVSPHSPVSPVSPGYAHSIHMSSDIPPLQPPSPRGQPSQAMARAIQTRPEVRPDGVVYHGHYVKVKVPRYVVKVDDEAAKLQLSKLRYHSEPNLADIDSDSLDDNVVHEASSPPQTPTTPVTRAVSDVTTGQDPQRENSPRTVVLQRGTNGFGFVLRGAKAQTTVGSSLDFTPTADFPALQYLDRVDKQSPADRAGLKPGDFLLEINGEVVVNATHEHTVNLIKYSGDTLAMKVITVKPLSPDGLERDIHADGTRTLPMKKKAAPAPPRRDPHTSLTASRATGRSIRESLAELEKLDMNLAQFDEADLDSAAVRRGVDLNNKTASIRTRQAQARLTAYEIEDMMTRQGMTQADVHHSASSQNKPMIPVGPVLPKTYNSVADMKKKNGNGTLNKNHRARSTPNLAQDGEMQIYQNSELASQRHVTHIEPNQSPSVYNRQASTPDTSTLGRRMANGSPALQREQMYAVPNTPQRRYGSVENVLEASVPAGGKYIIPPHPQEPAPAPPRPRSGIPPPPDHPPPIPPHDRTQTEVVKITKSPTYANVSAHIQQQKRSESDYESSFRPGIGARLNKEPIVPPSVVIPKLSHSRTTSNISSGSDNSGDQKPLNVRGTVEIFEQSTSGHSPHVQKDPVETATKFVKDHPGANVLYTTETKGQNGGQVYEPEPDYDDTDQGVVSHVPEVRSLRESWQISGHKTRQAPATPPSSRASHLVTQSSRVTESHYTPPQRNKVTTPTTPTTPRTPDQEKGGSMSAFSSAIKAAAVAREQKKSSPPVQPPPPPPPAVTREHASQAARSNGGPNAPPPPPPPPPPSAAEPRASPKPVRNGTPPQVRRQVEERRNDPHAALMAAIAKRRGLVDQAKGGESIEEKIQKNKKASPVAKPPVIKTESRPAPKSQAPPPPKELPKPNPAPVPPTSNTSSPSPSDEPTNFRAMAERARQEYLQKKAAGTLDRRKGSPSPHSRSSPQSPTSPNEEEKENEPQKAKTLNNQCSPIPAVSQQTNNSNNSGNSTGLGDIASVIAQRAMARQKSTSGMVDGSGNKMNEKSSHSTVYKSPASNSNGGSRQRGDGDKGLEVKGATVDVSHTESPRDERLSVFARAKMFESSKNQNRTSVTNGADLPFDLPPPVIEMNGTYVVDDIPPPMITPPPPEFDYSHSSELGIVSNGHTQNGHETVGWVINSSPPRYSTQEYAIRSKMATTNSYSVSPSLKETLVDEIQVDFIPPPPLFDGDLGPEPQLHTGKVVAEDAASMVSSLSTLSTVSSSEHDSYQHDSSGYSSSRNRFTPVHTSSVQSEEVFLEVAPPPPGFDDGGEDFIPPPMGFGLSGPDAQPQPVNNLRNNLRSTGRASQGYHSKAVEEWNTQDICDWLDSVNLGHLAIHFIRAGVRGDQLSRMGGQDYQMLGITNPDHQAMVERAVRRVQLNR